jgi:hypothetical protein
MRGLVLLSCLSVASGADLCCKACVAPLVKYYSVDVPHGFCGETCVNPSSYFIFKIFEKNLTLSDSDTPCSGQFTPVGTHYTEYSETVTHGVPGLLAVTLDLYGPGATVAAAASRGVQLGAYPGYSGDLQVTGEVNAYLSRAGNAYVTYDLKGLEDACKTTPEAVGNACGIHIHEGKTCDDASAVGGHYYDAGSISSDPWSPLGYNSRYGRAHGSVKAAIGKGEDIAGRAMVVHDSTGARVACALLPSKLAVKDEFLMV